MRSLVVLSVVGCLTAALTLSINLSIGDDEKSGAAKTNAKKTGAEKTSHQARAKQILDATGIQGGLVVHLGCGESKLTVALHASDRYRVHGLDRDAANVRKAREYVTALGFFGQVSIDRLAGTELPYVDNLVNLIVAERLGDVPMDEVVRVLAPKGVAYVKQDGQWTKTGQTAAQRDRRMDPLHARSHGKHCSP